MKEMQSKFNLDKLIAYLLIAVSIISCKSKNEVEKTDTIKIDKYEITIGQSLSQDEWKCKELTNELICFPASWKEYNQDYYYFAALPDTTNKEVYLVISKLNKTRYKIDENAYLKGGYEVLAKDTQEILINYDLKKLIFDDGHSFYIECEVEKAHQKYLMFSMVFTVGDDLYDIVVKSKIEDQELYRKLYQNILFNFKIDNKFFFARKREIIEYKPISPNELFRNG